MSSTREVCFLARIHCLRYSWAFAPLFHSVRISSKPSSCSGTENLVKEVFRVNKVRSGTACFRKSIFFSSAVSTTFGGCSSLASGSAGSSTSSSSSSGSSSFASSASSSTVSPAAIFRFLSASTLAFSAVFLISSNFLFFSFSAFTLAFSSSFWRFSRSFLRVSSTFFSLNSVSDCACLLFRMSSDVSFLNSAVGSPRITWATFLWLPPQRPRLWVLNSLIRLPRTSITTKFLSWSGVMVCSIRCTLRSSISLMPKFISGLSMDVLKLWRAKPLFSAHSRIMRSDSSV
mmetsp:Transcript_38709/g.62470  ORF Transcript_38709/g.62470 Transcript_38709/m.62470 type:complete len:288 (-) Transcript_38709:234-1097(-)